MTMLMLGKWNIFRAIDRFSSRDRSTGVHRPLPAQYHPSQQNALWYKLGTSSRRCNKTRRSFLFRSYRRSAPLPLKGILWGIYRRWRTIDHWQTDGWTIHGGWESIHSRDKCQVSLLHRSQGFQAVSFDRGQGSNADDNYRLWVIAFSELGGTS